MGLRVFQGNFEEFRWIFSHDHESRVSIGFFLDFQGISAISRGVSGDFRGFKAISLGFSECLECFRIF